MSMNNKRNRAVDANDIMKLRNTLIQNVHKAKKMPSLQEAYDRTMVSIKDALMCFPQATRRSFIVNSHHCAYNSKDITKILEEFDAIKAELDEARCAHANLIDIGKQYVNLINEILDTDELALDDLKLPPVEVEEELEKPYDNCKNCKCTDPATCKKCATMVDPEDLVDNNESVGADEEDEVCEESEGINGNEDVFRTDNHVDRHIIERFGGMDVQSPHVIPRITTHPVMMPMSVPTTIPHIPSLDIPDDIDRTIGDVEIDPSTAIGDVTEVRDITINVGGDIIVDSYNGRNSRNN